MTLKLFLLLVLVFVLWQESAGVTIGCTIPGTATIPRGTDQTVTCITHSKKIVWDLFSNKTQIVACDCSFESPKCRPLYSKTGCNVTAVTNKASYLIIPQDVLSGLKSVICRGYNSPHDKNVKNCTFNVIEPTTTSRVIPPSTSTSATTTHIPSAPTETAPTTPSGTATQGSPAKPPQGDDDDNDDSSSSVELIAICAAAGLLLIVLIAVLIIFIKRRKNLSMKNKHSQAVKSSASEAVEYINDTYVSADVFNNPPDLLSSDTYTAPDDHTLAASSRMPTASSSASAASASAAAAAITLKDETKNQQASMSLTHPSPEQLENQSISTPTSAPSEDVYAQVQKKPKKNLVLEEKAEAETEQVYAQVKKPKRPA